MRLTSTFLAILLAITAGYGAAQTIPAIEREALIALYDATDGDKWTINDGWDTAVLDTECMWYGVTCEGGFVTGISLETNELNGTIPTELGNLGQLTSLYLYDNQLSGTIPMEIWSLDQLRFLGLAISQLSGSIPPEVENLTNLEWLVLGDNQLTGTIPAEIGNLSQLTWLLLSENQLSGTIPPAIWGLGNLLRLYLYDNQLTGTIPPEIGDLVLLEEIAIDRNNLTGEIPAEFADLAGLIEPSYIRYNALWTDDPATQAYLDGWYPQWDETQTVPPANVAAVATSSSKITVSWTPILYADDAGGYWVHTARAEVVFADGFESGDTSAWGGLPPIVDVTNNKSRIDLVINGLDPATEYQFVVRTITDPHALNQNQVISDPSEIVFATTLP